MRWGDGVIWDTGTGTWMYKFVHRGKTHRKRGYKTATEARQACLAKRLLIEGSGDSIRMSFPDAVTQYLHHHAPPRLAGGTYDKYVHSLGLMAQRWRDRDLRDISGHLIEEWMRWRLSTPTVVPLFPGATMRTGKKFATRTVGAATVNRDLATLSALFTWAMERGRGWISENPCRGLKRLPEPRRTYLPITPLERKEIASYLGHWAVRAELLHALGVRIGVIWDLRWEQVDFGTRTLQYRSKGRDITRVLGKRAMAILESLGPKPAGRVFPQGSQNAFRNCWARAVKAIGRPGARPHDLRITFAREMADEGVDTGTIRDMLGHSSSRMTERYIGSSRSAQIRATELHDIRAGFV